MTIVENYLKDELKQARLFEDITAEIKDILYAYDFQKLVFVDHGGQPGELIVEVQEEFPSQLINALDEYVGFPCTIKKTQYRIRLTYKLEEDHRDGKVCAKRKKCLR